MKQTVQDLLLVLLWVLIFVAIGLGVYLVFQSKAKPAEVKPVTQTQPSKDTYGTCDEYHDAGIGDIPRSDPRYLPELDKNDDGLACNF